MAGLVLQTRGVCLAFGWLWLVWRSKCAQLFSRFEGCSWFGAPNAGNSSRVWRVVAGLVLQTRGIHLAFGGFLSFYPQLIFFLLSHFFAR